MPLPPYAQWQAARPVLHQAAQILNMARVASLDPQPNALRHSLRPLPTGATTGPLKFGGALTLDYVEGAVILAGEDGSEITRVLLNEHTQQSLGKTVFAAIAQQGHVLDQSKFAETPRFNLDQTQGRLYAEVQWRMFQTLALLKAHMFGPQNPLVLWPHGFDLSTLWFVDGMEERTDPHLNFGFSPGTPDVGQPYVYFYAHPALHELKEHLPGLVTWTTSWSAPGGYIPYDRFADETDPEALLLETLLDIYHRASALLKAG